MPRDCIYIKQLCDVMDIFTNFVLVITLQCIHLSKQYMVYPKYKQLHHKKNQKTINQKIYSMKVANRKAVFSLLIQNQVI